jgi:hypothetical protein
MMVPAITSNQAGVWTGRQRFGFVDAVPGLGRHRERVCLPLPVG